jgi:hypothetical protein
LFIFFQILVLWTSQSSPPPARFPSSSAWTSAVEVIWIKAEDNGTTVSPSERFRPRTQVKQRRERERKRKREKKKKERRETEGGEREREKRERRERERK